MMVKEFFAIIKPPDIHHEISLRDDGFISSADYLETFFGMREQKCGHRKDIVCMKCAAMCDYCFLCLYHLILSLELEKPAELFHLLKHSRKEKPYKDEIDNIQQERYEEAPPFKRRSG